MIDMDGLRAGIEAEIARQLAEVGAGNVDRSAILKKFVGKGKGQGSRASVYRLISACLDGGKEVQRAIRTAKLRKHATPQAKAAARRIVDLAEVDQAAAAAEMGQHLPVSIQAGELMGLGVVKVMDKLRECASIAEDVIRHAQTDEGKPRIPKLLLMASEHLRRTSETTVKIAEAINEAGRIQAFNQAVIRVVERASPDLARQVMEDLTLLATQWGG